MKEPNVQVGILTEKRIAFSLSGLYLATATYCSGVVTYQKYVEGGQTAQADNGKIVWNDNEWETLRFDPVIIQNDPSATTDDASDASVRGEAPAPPHFELKDVVIGRNFHWERKENQRFLGSLKLIAEADRLTAINLINVEEYLTSVISSEMSATASLELLKAHAVISRSWLLSSLSPNPSPVGRGVDSTNYEEKEDINYKMKEDANYEAKENTNYRTADRFNYGILKENQQRLKKEPTEAEKIVWERVRNNQLGTKFRRQHIIDSYIADFVSLEKMLIIELDGEYHNTTEQKEKDKERTLHLEALGYRLLRFTNNEVISQPDLVINKIKAYMTLPNIKSFSRPSPLPTGENEKNTKEISRVSPSPLPTGENEKNTKEISRVSPSPLPTGENEKNTKEISRVSPSPLPTGENEKNTKEISRVSPSPLPTGENEKNTKEISRVSPSPLPTGENEKNTKEISRVSPSPLPTGENEKNTKEISRVSPSPLPTGENEKNTKEISGVSPSPLPTGEGPGERLLWYERDAHTHFDVCADDHCQRYQGITRASNEAVKQAIAATRGQVLTFDGKICDARFSKCCGGALEEFQYCWDDVRHPYLAYKRDWIPPTGTPDSPSPLSAEENTKEAPPSPLPTGEGSGERLIRSAPPAFCNTTNKRILSQVLNDYDQETTDFYRWKVEYTQEEFSKLIKERSGIDYGQIIDLVPIARGTSGRLWKLKIVGTKRTLIIGKELEIRRTLSPSHLYSSAFVVDKEELSAEGIPGRFILTGAGWGHGVGLCQIGAAVMSEYGYKYDAILRHYYKGANLEKLYC